jgi:O-antigen ligase
MNKLKNLSINDCINYLFILYALLLPLSRAGISILSALLIILWLFSGDLKNKIKSIKYNRVIIYICLYIGFATLSLLWTDDVNSGIDYIRRYWYFLPIIVIATTIKKEYLHYSVSAFLAGIFISILISYGIFFELFTINNSKPHDPSPFMNHLQYSMFLGFSALIILNKFFFITDLKSRIIYFSLFLLTVSTLFISGGRTGQFAFVVSIFIVGFLNIKSKLMAFFAMLLLIISMFFITYQVSSKFQNRINHSINETKTINDGGDTIFSGSFGQRIGAWIIAGEIFIDNPILGIGVSKNMETLKRYIDNNHSNIDMSNVRILANYHNYYVQSLVKLGIIGLFLYLMIFYNILRLNIKDKQYYNMMIIFVTIYGTSSLFENMFHQQFSEAIFALFVGIFIAKNRIENEV